MMNKKIKKKTIKQSHGFQAWLNVKIFLNFFPFFFTNEEKFGVAREEYIYFWNLYVCVNRETCAQGKHRSY